MHEFCRVLSGRGKKGLDFALLAAGYDAGGKRVSTILRLRSSGCKLGGQRLVDRDIVERAETLLQRKESQPKAGPDT